MDKIPNSCRSSAALQDSEHANWTPKTLKGERQLQQARIASKDGARLLAAKDRRNAKEETLLGALCSTICEHQIGLSINLILLLFLTHICFPRARRRTGKFFHLSYYNPDNGLYGLGRDDLPFVLLWVVLFTGIRAAIMDYILYPLARAGGIKSRKGAARFAEQAWLLIYCSCFWSLGMYLMYNSEYWLNLHNMWVPWPIREVRGLFKWYYLAQFAFWLQQILVVNIEEKRKDYAQMFSHHIITSILIFMSYGSYQFRVGNVVLCIMDVGDIVLAIAKILKYLGYRTAPDIVFGIFVAVWVVARHCFYLMVCWSLYADSVPCGCSLPDGRFVPLASTEEFEKVGGNKVWKNVAQVYLDREGTVCWNPAIRSWFLSLLLMLQLLMVLWFAMIMRVIWKVIKGNAADDVRSDDEEADEKIEEGDFSGLENGAALLHHGNVVRAVPDYRAQEQEVGVESLTFSRRSSPGVRSSYRRSSGGRGGRASGISIPGHGDRKELLGRIGCDKPT